MPNKTYSILIACLIFFSQSKIYALVDPTRPPNVAFSTRSIVQQEFNLSAIFIYPTYKLAMIDGKAVMVGDSFAGYIVTNMTPFSVELIDKENRKEVLTLIASVKHKD
jgi:hypothetical protein